MTSARVLVALAASISLTSAAAITTCGCTASNGVFTLSAGAPYSEKFAAWAKFDDSLFERGWGALHVYANSASAASDEDALFCAGMVEGALTHERIAKHFKLYKQTTTEDVGSKDGEWPNGLVDYIQQNIDYTRAKAAANKHSDAWWRQAQYVLVHTDGIREGYLRLREESDPLIMEVDMWLLQSAGDMDDLEVFVKMDGKTKPAPKTTQWHDTHHHCTGSVFLMPDFSDLYFAQDAWQGYTSLGRMNKDYDFRLRSQGASQRWTFASHPGMGFSMDDFWQLDSGLLVLETTLHTWNTTLYDLHCTPQSIFCWIRVQVANRLGYDGQSWVQNFVRENSGTYNNQYFVVDLNKLALGKRPEKDLLWAVEQLPGDYEAGDRTAELVKNGYVPSINTPAFERIYNKAGYPDQVKATQSDYWTYWNCSRMKIFQRDAPNVLSYKEFQAFMRLNKYQTDPLTSGDPARSILSRYDLRPDECIHEGTMVQCPAAFGGTDAKTTNYNLAKALQFDMVNSPNYEDQKPWEFGTERWKDVPYDGLPKTWAFPWGTFGPEKP